MSGRRRGGGHPMAMGNAHAQQHAANASANSNAVNGNGSGNGNGLAASAAGSNAATIAAAQQQQLFALHQQQQQQQHLFQQQQQQLMAAAAGTGSLPVQTVRPMQQLGAQRQHHHHHTHHPHAIHHHAQNMQNNTTNNPINPHMQFMQSQSSSSSSPKPLQQQQQPAPPLVPYVLETNAKRRLISGFGRITATGNAPNGGQVPEAPPAGANAFTDSLMQLGVGPGAIPIESQFADVYPRTGDEFESTMEEQHIKMGLGAISSSQTVESFSAFEVYKDKLNGTQGDLVGALKRLAGNVERHLSSIVSSETSFKPPAAQRDVKSDAWISRLCSPKEPLDKLIASFPKHFQHLSELLPEIFKRQPSMQRAAWFIKCTLADTNSGSGSANVPGGGGGGSRNRYGSGKPPSYELHDLVCKYLSSQLDKFAKSSGFGSVAPGSGGPGTPNIPSLSVNSKGSGFGKDNMGQVGAGFGLENFKTIESRNAFVSSWMYCIDFIGYCYAEGLIDQKQILKWLVEKLGVNSSNFVQLNLLLPLIWNLVGEFAKSRALTRHFLDAIIPRAKAIKPLAPTSELIAMQYANLVHFIQYMAISAPDAFLSVETWGKSVDVRGDVFRGGGDGSPSAFLLKSISDAKRICLLRELRELERSIERRIRDVQYQVRKSPETPVAANVLNLKDCEEICIPTLAKRWFGLTGTSTSPPPISKPIKELIRWALLPAVGGNLEFRRRVYLVSSLLMEVVRFANFGSGRARVQVVLMEYLTDFVMKGDVMDVDIGPDYKNIIWLFGDFIRSHLFSVANFLQRLISRGCFEDSQHKDRYLKLIVDLPVLDTGNHISNTRLELRKENDDMEAHEAERQETSEMMDLLRKIAPALFNASMSAADTFESRTVSRDEAGRLWKLFLDQSSRANSFVHSQVAKWIKHEYENYVVKSVAINAENWKKHISSLSAGSSLLSVEQYLMVVFVYENFEDLRGILELNLWLLVNRFDKKLNACIIETFRKYTYCFRYMNELGNIANTLWINRQSFVVHSSAGVNILENTFVSYLNTIYTWLSAEHREKWATFVTESQVPKVNKEPVTQEFGEIRDLKDNEDSIISSIHSLSFRFGNSSDASRRILVYSILVMYKFAAANNATLTQKRVNMTVRVLQGYNDHGSFLDTHFGEILAGFLGDAPSPTTLPISASVSESWFANFAVQLILSQCCRVQTVVDKFLAPVVSQQFGQSKLEQVPRFLTALSILNVILVVDVPRPDSGLFGPDEVECHRLSALRGSDLQQRDLFCSLFDILFKLHAIKDRYESTLASVKPQDSTSITAAITIMKAILDSACSVAWFKVLVEANPDLIRRKLISPWLATQRELAIAALAPASSRTVKKVSLPPSNTATIGKRLSKSFIFLRSVFSRTGDLMFDLSLDRSELPQLLRSMVSCLDESNYSARKMRMFLMFEEVAILSLLKSDARLDGFEEYLGNVFSDLFTEMNRTELNFWLYQLIPELPSYTLIKIVRLIRIAVESSLQSISLTDMIAETFDDKIEHWVEICCYASKILSELAGKDRQKEVVDECRLLYDSIVNQLDWFLMKKDDILQIEIAGRTVGQDVNQALVQDSLRDVRFLNSLRKSLTTRLRILGSLIPFMRSNLDSCNPLRTIEVLIQLSVSGLVEGSEIPLGDFVLDYAVFILETPECMVHPDLKGLRLTQGLQPKLILRRSLLRRLERILPFQFDSAYMNGLISTVDLTRYPSSALRDITLAWNANKHLDPFQWIEVRKRSLQDTLEGGEAELPEGEACVKDIGRECINDTALSISLFGTSLSSQPRLLLGKGGGGKLDAEEEGAKASGPNDVKGRSEALFHAIISSTKMK